MTRDADTPTAAALGEFIRAQRRHAGMSLRDLAGLARVSNPYLSQVERGQHAPSLRVLMGIADALGIAADVLLAEAGVKGDDSPPARGGPDTERAIRADPVLSAAEKEALLTVYRSYVSAKDPVKPAAPKRKPR